METTKRILIVDDEPNIVMSLEYLMRSKGLEVGIARSGTEALEQMEQASYDLVLLDITMPDLDGYHVCKTIKAHPEWQKSHVVFLSAKASKAILKKACLWELLDYIVKPFSTRDLSQRILDILSQ